MPKYEQMPNPGGGKTEEREYKFGTLRNIFGANSVAELRQGEFHRKYCLAVSQYGPRKIDIRFLKTVIEPTEVERMEPEALQEVISEIRDYMAYLRREEKERELYAEGKRNLEMEDAHKHAAFMEKSHPEGKEEDE